MKFVAEIRVMPREGLLDPQGKAVSQGLNGIGLTAVLDAKVGKLITLQLNANSEAEALQIAEEASTKLLANLIMESYAIVILPA